MGIVPNIHHPKTSTHSQIQINRSSTSSTFRIMPVLRGTPPPEYLESSTQFNRNRNHGDRGLLGSIWAPRSIQTTQLVHGNNTVSLMAPRNRHPGPLYAERQFPLRNSTTMVPTGRNEAIERILRAADADFKTIRLDSFDDSQNFRASSCIICTKTFSHECKPPACISHACTHEPSVCSDCVCEYLEHELSNNVWNRIECPECAVLLEYDDIKRLANAGTFSSALASDDNFVWCRQCEFGQSHEGGAGQPIVRCMQCGSRSCFHHSVPWHDRLTCEEYDEMLRDPDGFEGAVDKANEEVARAREKQENEEARRNEKREQKRRRAQIQQERQDIKKRLENETLSLAEVAATSKRCPECTQPIELIEGCSHMTCKFLIKFPDDSSEHQSDQVAD
ncbi:hypothetical protein VTL71DRAFT_9563 [Oculimacula yallundae]|uniref:RBR-type E3 ubiquitin transferase n=1 Tax=Oculimacula yallundae TaxID=86028 RepID=A0ABR4BRA1_9HELO